MGYVLTAAKIRTADRINNRSVSLAVFTVTAISRLLVFVVYIKDFISGLEGCKFDWQQISIRRFNPLIAGNMSDGDACSSLVHSIFSKYQVEMHPCMVSFS